MTRNSGNGPKPGPDLDAAIDEAVRAMTHVDADASFRVRVLDRIGRRRQAPAHGFRLMAAAAACAAIVLAVVLSRAPGPAEVPPSDQQATRQSAPATPPPEAPRPAAAPASERRERRIRAGAETSTRSNVIAAAVAPVADVGAATEPPPGVEIVPLSDLTPIGITPLEPAPIAASDIAIAPVPVWSRRRRRRRRSRLRRASNRRRHRRCRPPSRSRPRST
jgi:hypothetical protein